MKMNIRIVAVLLLIGLARVGAVAHDTWLQTNQAIVRVGDAIYVDLMLGNHGNDHRDFKVADKADLKSCALTLIDPNGVKSDLKPDATDEGLATKEGFFSVRITPSAPGLYLVSQTSDAVASYAPERVIRSAKTFFLASKSLDKPSADAPGFDRVLGDPLEIVPLNSPIAPMGPGTAIKVKVLFKGKPDAGERVSFIPRGITLADGFDANYERKTDEQGVASFEPKEADYYLIAVHHDAPDEKGTGYDSTKYSATMTVIDVQTYLLSMMFCWAAVVAAPAWNGSSRYSSSVIGPQLMSATSDTQCVFVISCTLSSPASVLWIHEPVSEPSLVAIRPVTGSV
jgi:uncharacterized GH25 family protein